MTSSETEDGVLIVENPEDDVVRKRSVVIAGHATSISLEEIFWRELKAIADRRKQSLASLITGIDAERAGNLSSALRVFVMRSVMQARAGDSRPE